MRHLLLLALVAFPALATAQPVSEAEVLFAAGRELMRTGKFADACDAFDASQKAAYAVTTLVNQANCREKNRQFATALGLFREAGERTLARADKLTDSLHTTANERAVRLEARVSTLQIVVPSAARAGLREIVRDGNVLPTASWDRPLPIDGGTHRIAVRWDDDPVQLTAIEVSPERDRRVITLVRSPSPAPAPASPSTNVPAIAAAAAPVTRAPAREVSPPAQNTPPQIPSLVDDSTYGSAPASLPRVVARSYAGHRLPSLAMRDDGPRARRDDTGALVATSGAFALLAGGLALELSGRNTYEDAKAETDLARRHTLYDQANLKRYLAQGLAVAGVGSAALALWLHLRDERRPARPAVARVGSFDLNPTLGTQQAGLSLSTTY